MRSAGTALVESVKIDDGYFSLVALSRYAGLSVRTLRSHLAHPTNPLPHYKPGGKVLVKRSEFDRWMAQFRESGESTRQVVQIADQVLRGL